jgi:hypothetical protein
MGSLDDDHPKPLSSRYILRLSRCKPAVIMGYIVLVLFLLVGLAQVSSFSTTATIMPFISTEELQERLADLRGSDVRLIRWDATGYTQKCQRASCQEGLPDALAVIMIAGAGSKNKDELLQHKAGLACEYATFCVTNNPEQRARLSSYGRPSEDSSSSDDTNGSGATDIHASLVALVASDSSYTSAMASHLIYIATFANHDNQQGLAKAGAVGLLGDILTKDSGVSNLQIMWAAAALQNLAASYCDTGEDDGRCYWKWKKNHEGLVLQSKQMRILSNGEAIRQEMLENHKLMDRLMELACTGPVQGEMTSTNPYIGENAKSSMMHHHEESSNILAWAPAGALKNVAISSDGRVKIEGSVQDGRSSIPILQCLCRLSHSPDWLERNKGQGALHHLRPTDPCWFQDGDKAPNGKLCVDEAFLDRDGYTCSDYGDATAQECLATSAHNDETFIAKKACCTCGGGNPEESWSLTSQTK